MAQKQVSNKVLIFRCFSCINPKEIKAHIPLAIPMSRVQYHHTRRGCVISPSFKIFYCRNCSVQFLFNGKELEAIIHYWHRRILFCYSMTPCPTLLWGTGTDSYGFFWTPDALEQEENAKSPWWFLFHVARWVKNNNYFEQRKMLISINIWEIKFCYKFS